MSAGTITHYRCHAGLQCFAMTVELDNRRELAVIGGRAFVTSADYRATAERFREGDLHELLSTDLFSNVIFASEQDLDHAAFAFPKLRTHTARKTDEPVAPLEINETKKEESRISLNVRSARRSFALRASLERRTRFADSCKVSRSKSIQSSRQELWPDLTFRDSSGLLLLCFIDFKRSHRFVCFRAV